MMHLRVKLYYILTLDLNFYVDNWAICSRIGLLGLWRLPCWTQNDSGDVNGRALNKNAPCPRAKNCRVPDWPVSMLCNRCPVSYEPLSSLNIDPAISVNGGLTTVCVSLNKWASKARWLLPQAGSIHHIEWGKVLSLHTAQWLSAGIDRCIIMASLAPVSFVSLLMSRTTSGKDWKSNSLFLSLSPNRDVFGMCSRRKAALWQKTTAFTRCCSVKCN